MPKAPKRRIEMNRFDNWYGYEGGRRVVSFANDAQATAETKAKAWLVETAPEGRELMCIGPNCWGRAKTAAEAITNALANFSRSYSGEWKYIMYDVPPGARVDDCGFNISYEAKRPDGTEHAPSKERYRVVKGAVAIL